MNADAVKQALAALGVRPSKRLGQNFMIDERPLFALLEAVEIAPADVVVEVGAGLGALTEALAQKAKRVVAVEKDTRLVSFLETRFAGRANVVIVPGDVLDLLKEAGTGLPPTGNYKMAGNLPYSSAPAILRRFLESPHRPSRIAVLVQKEVAERITAKPPDMNLLALGVQAYGTPSIAGMVGRNAFWPRPEVDSAIVAVADIHPCAHADALFRAARAGFSHPRKKLGGNLASGLLLSRERAESILRTAGIDTSRRAETLSLEEWHQIARQIAPALPA